MLSTMSQRVLSLLRKQYLVLPQPTSFVLLSPGDQGPDVCLDPELPAPHDGVQGHRARGGQEGPASPGHQQQEAGRRPPAAGFLPQPAGGSITFFCCIFALTNHVGGSEDLQAYDWLLEANMNSASTSKLYTPIPIHNYNPLLKASSTQCKLVALW